MTGGGGGDAAGDAPEAEETAEADKGPEFDEGPETDPESEAESDLEPKSGPEPKLDRDLTAGQQDVRRSAESYLDPSGSSRSVLVQQLESEGYTREHAELGVTYGGL